uniref:Granulins domain-containing protein n=1 Tax=Kalanchoe fedtschenkoi TaxID=63787 RepID=A0A7N0U311_KALFE
MASYPTKSSSSPSPSPSLSSSPPPPPPPSSSPPSPLPPSPSQCGDSSYCSSDETRCCVLKLYSYCFFYGCCEYENAVCCSGTEYCCPSDDPVCDVDEGVCLQVRHTLQFSQPQAFKTQSQAMKRKMAKHELRWSRLEKKHKEGSNLE